MNKIEFLITWAISSMVMLIGEKITDNIVLGFILGVVAIFTMVDVYNCLDK